ncbi:hypothetical protein [Candidatus Bathycorpusculum sp.]|uniref:hypothetical protein n=1 Tax=Candidatus Bathycorpusculum sp. TaxID=2994959 RepID=UPI0028181BE8|nr:hypothetical protein [Candidatus Termitimicrobium sp.]
MRNYILTPNEREIIKEYLNTDKRLDGFKLILSLARKHQPEIIVEDEELIKKLLAKAGENKVI